MLTESARILARRWVWAAASLVVAVLLGLAAYAVVPASHDSNATVLFVPPSTQPGIKGRVNPFYSLGGSTLVMTTVVEVLVNDDTTSTRLASKGYRAKYEVTPNLALNAGPTLLVKVSDRSASMAQATLAAVLREVSDQLTAVQTQQGVTSDLLISSVKLTPAPHQTVDHKNQIQTGAITTVGVAFILFTLILLWERRRLPGIPPAPEAQVGTDPNPPSLGPFQRGEPTTTPANLAGQRSGSRQAHRKARVALNTRRRIGRADGPGRSGR